MRRVAVFGAVAAALAWLLRLRLVDLLTKTTGTWVGSPPSPTSASRQANANEPR